MKRDAQNVMMSYRTRLVAQGQTQVKGADYFSDDTFTPVAKMDSQHANTALAAKRSYEDAQIKIKSTFLYGRLKDDKVIYMRPPVGITLKGIKPGQVLHLKVALYGLKQAGCHWAMVLHEIMRNAGLVHSKHDHAVFYHHLSNNNVAIICSHVDNLTLLAPDKRTIEYLSDKICTHVEATPLQRLHWLLSIEITRNLDNRTISFLQRAYINGFDDIKPLSTSMDSHLQLSKDDSLTTPADIAAMRHKPY